MLRWIELEQGPRTVLNQATDFRLAQPQHVNEDQWWSVLLEISTSIDAFIAAVFADGSADHLIVPVAYDAADRQIPSTRQPVSVFLRQSLLKAINADPEQFGVLWLQEGVVTPDRFLYPDAQWPSTEPITVHDDSTLMAVIDDGIGIGHDLFRDGICSSRVKFAAILDAEPLSGNAQSSVGRILTKAWIDDRLDACTFADLLDEDRFYSVTGQLDYAEQVFSTVALRASHGTHIAALAAGHPMEKQVADRPILCVALPSRIVEDTSGVSLLPSLYLGFHMLVKEAARYQTESGHPVPVMFNFSYGSVGGPHDGTGLFSRLFEHYFGQATDRAEGPEKAWLTLPAGNNNLARLHAVGTPGRVLEFETLPDDKTATEVQLWMPFIGRDKQPLIEIEVSAPFTPTAKLPTDSRKILSLVAENGSEQARLSYGYAKSPVDRGYAILSINPTASETAQALNAPSGTWGITISGDTEAVQQTNIWIRRDETLPGFRPGGRQARFVDPMYQRFGEFGLPLAVDPKETKASIRRSGTISGFACGQTPIVVAAYSDADRRLSLYSAAGPLNKPASPESADRDGPDMSVKGDDSHVRQGVLSAGSRSGTRVRLSGTSVASPRVARAAADIIGTATETPRQWGRAPHGPDIQPLDLAKGVDSERSGSGAYDISVDFNGPGTG